MCISSLSPLSLASMRRFPREGNFPNNLARESLRRYTLARIGKNSSRGTNITRLLLGTRVPSYRTCCNSTMVRAQPYRLMHMHAINMRQTIRNAHYRALKFTWSCIIVIIETGRFAIRECIEIYATERGEEEERKKKKGKKKRSRERFSLWQL